MIKYGYIEKTTSLLQYAIYVCYALNNIKLSKNCGMNTHIDMCTIHLSGNTYTTSPTHNKKQINVTPKCKLFLYVRDIYQVLLIYLIYLPSFMDVVCFYVERTRNLYIQRKGTYVCTFTCITLPTCMHIRFCTTGSTGREPFLYTLLYVYNKHTKSVAT